MPSFRVAIDIHAVLPGVMPPEILPLAERILARTHRVEDRSVELTGPKDRPQPQIHLRFYVESLSDEEEDAEAEAAVRALVGELAEVADCGGWVLRRGPGGHWRTIREGIAPPPPEFPVQF